MLARREAQIALQDGFLDNWHQALLPRRDEQAAGFLHGNAGHLLDRRRGAVVVHVYAVQNGRIGASGADSGERHVKRVQGFVHAFGGILFDFFDHALRPPAMRVPTLAPRTAFVNAPGRAMLQTTIGNSCSSQR